MSNKTGVNNYYGNLLIPLATFPLWKYKCTQGIPCRAMAFSASIGRFEWYSQAHSQINDKSMSVFIYHDVFERDISMTDPVFLKTNQCLFINLIVRCVKWREIITPTELTLNNCLNQYLAVDSSNLPLLLTQLKSSPLEQYGMNMYTYFSSRYKS